MDINNYFDDISFTSLRNDLSSMSWKTVRKDIIAALSVALLTIPQAMAYALVAGLPMSCGIFSAIFSAALASFCGSSRHLIVGPTSAIAIMIQAGTAQILFNDFRDLDTLHREYMAVNILMQLTAMVALFQLAAASLKLGRLAQFVSHPVIVGYLLGVACAVAVTQLYTLLGLPKYEGAYSTYEKMILLASSLREIHPPTAIVGLLSLLIFTGLKKIDRRIPSGVVGLVAISFLVNAYSQLADGGFLSGANLDLEETTQIALIGDTDLLHGLLPSIALPYFNWKLINSMIPFAFAVSLLSVLEATSVAKSIAATSGQRLSVNQEILGVGLGNILSSLIGAMPLSGSPSRSMLNYEMGAQSRLSALFSACFVGLFLYFFESLISQIPIAALAALLLMTVKMIVNREQLSLCMNATSSDAFVLWITVLSCLFFSLEIAFYIGVGMSITLYLTKAAAPQLIECALDEKGAIRPVKTAQVMKHRKIRFIKVKGELFFGAADIFHSTLKSLTAGDTATKVIVIQVKNARDMDATACLALQQLHNSLSFSGRHLIICGIPPAVWKVLKDSGLVDILGMDNLFPYDDREPDFTITKAMERAEQLIRESDDIAKMFTPIDTSSSKIIALEKGV